MSTVKLTSLNMHSCVYNYNSVVNTSCTRCKHCSIHVIEVPSCISLTVIMVKTCWHPFLQSCMCHTVRVKGHRSFHVMSAVSLIPLGVHLEYIAPVGWQSRCLKEKCVSVCFLRVCVGLNAGHGATVLAKPCCGCVFRKPLAWPLRVCL